MLREPCVPREHHCTCAQSVSPAHLANYRGIVAAERTVISSHPMIFSDLCNSIRLSSKPRLKPGFASEGDPEGPEVICRPGRVICKMKGRDEWLSPPK